jgi:hypothetical protein
MSGADRAPTEREKTLQSFGASAIAQAHLSKFCGLYPLQGIVAGLLGPLSWGELNGQEGFGRTASGAFAGKWMNACDKRRRQLARWTSSGCGW